ncbi:unnamed protein product [Pleuronectes platessa]|uniref:Uncharacterized protein n=1 Tax=Pleuronectes platessa TaxID=8262 RepID=A0A9N7TWG2_PLEPL|nr:unnamed protein product [Pleuronectes platessa]
MSDVLMFLPPPLPPPPRKRDVMRTETRRRHEVTVTFLRHDPVSVLRLPDNRAPSCGGRRRKRRERRRKREREQERERARSCCCGQTADRDVACVLV